MQALLRASSVIPAPGLRSGASPKQSSAGGGQILSKINDVSPPARFSTVARQHRQRQRGHQSTPAGALQPRRSNAGRGVSIAVQASSSTSDDQNGGVDNGDENQNEESTTTPAASGAGAKKAKTNTDDADADDEKKTTSKKENDDEEESSPAALPLADDDVAPALESDWRDFRAMLVSQEATGQATDESPNNSDDAVASASGENLELLKKQNPKLASEKPWAHVIGAPEKGCLLLASDDEFKVGQQYFHQAVILILEHHDKGSMGVILNRPTQYNMDDERWFKIKIKTTTIYCTNLRSLLDGYVSGDASGPFAANALYFGGDVGDGTVSFLHGSELVRGSAEVLPGVFVGGYDSACELVKAGDIAAKDFKFFARYCGWGPGQLESECARGVWYPVCIRCSLCVHYTEACSKQLALKQVIQLPKPLWREVLELCGGDLKEASKRAYGELEEKEENER